MAREINLVPSSKFETIKAIRLRNFLLFLCIVVAGGAIAVVFILGTIMGGQRLIRGGKENMLKLYSQKINSYSELSDFLTIKDQLGKLKSIADEKNLISRTFSLLPVFAPANGDDLNFSSIEMSFEADAVVLEVQALADAVTEPYIDYNVLDAFKKLMDYYSYDYGRYVNELGDTIPSYCIIENDPETGSLLNEDGKYYAFWTAKVDGCDPRHPVDLLSDESEEEEKSGDEDDEAEMAYTYEAFDGQDVVKIWRTPQFKEWYDSEYMDESGSIQGIPHFESSCTTYTGSKDEASGEVYFSSSNDSCKLIVNGADGFRIDSSSNGRDQDSNLILSFSGYINIDTNFFKLQNTHMVALGPNGRHNVTDSYMQVQSLFVPPAIECKSDDLECLNGGK